MRARRAAAGLAAPRGGGKGQGRSQATSIGEFRLDKAVFRDLRGHDPSPPERCASGFRGGAGEWRRRAQ
jgi:hypothetical protein